MITKMDWFNLANPLCLKVILTIKLIKIIIANQLAY